MTTMLQSKETETMDKGAVEVCKCGHSKENHPWDAFGCTVDLAPKSGGFRCLCWTYSAKGGN